jgi:6-phosphofructokinase 1
MVVELMGRYAGWLALHAGVASGADVILIPEIPFTLDSVARKCLERSRVGKRFTIVAAGEGAYPVGGQQFVDHVDPSSPDPVRLGGIGKYVTAEIEKRTGLESRAIVLGHVQRGGTPTARDRALATDLGFAAFELLVRGELGRVVVEQAGRITSTAISDVAGKVRTVPLDHSLLRAARAVGTCFGD